MNSKPKQSAPIRTRHLACSVLTCLLAFGADLAAAPVAFFNEPLNSDPGWLKDGGWEFGVPAGGGTHGKDPTAGKTGSNVFGYNLNGDYPNSLAVTHYLTTPAINCSGHAAIKLGYWRWLGVDFGSLDKVSVQASADGVNWTTVFSNSTSYSDTSWVYVQHDISAVADGQPAVYLRWSLGTTNSTTTYPGWNIDDIDLTGEPGVAAAVAISATDSFAYESGANTGTFTLTRTGPTTNPLTVNLDYSGSSNCGSDYAIPPAAVTIPAGAATQTFNVTPFDDLAVEGNETVTAQIVSGAGYALGATITASATIYDNDQSSVSVSATDNLASEAGPDTGTFTLTRSGGILSRPLTVATLMEGTATNGTDYAAVAASVTFPADITSVTVLLTPVNDAVFDPNETAVLRVATPPGPEYLVGTPTATVTIADNEDPLVSISATDNAMTEGSDGASFTFSRTGPTTAALTVNFSTDFNDTASSSDHSAIGSSITIPAGSATAVLNVTATNDATVEAVETLIVVISASANYNVGVSDRATVSIYDNEPTQLSLTVTDSVASERGGFGEFTISRTGSLVGSVTANLQFAGTAILGADVPNLSTTQALGDGVRSVSVAFTALADVLVEGTETVTATLLAGAGYTLGTALSGTVNVADDDVDHFDVINIDFVWDAASAVYAGDQGILSSPGGTTWNKIAGFSSGAGTLQSQTGVVKKVELSQLVQTVTSGGANLPYSDGYGNSGGGAIFTLLNLDPDRSYDIAAYCYDNDSRFFLTSADGDSFRRMSKPITGVMPGLEDGDYLLFRNVRPAIFGSGYAGIQLLMPASSSSFFEDSVIVALQIRENPGTPPAVVTVAANDATATEAGATTGQFTVSRTGSTAASLTVNFTVSGTAASPADFASLGGSVTIPAGQPSATVTVTPVDDAVTEGGETVVLTLSSSAAYAIGSLSTATVTITDNDLPSVTISAIDSTATEAGATTGQFSLTRTGALDAGLAVALAVTGTANSPVDYACVEAATVTIPAGQASLAITVTPIDDTAFEGDETVIFTVSPNAAYTVGATPTATVTITDNDLPTVTVTANDPTATEAGMTTGQFTISRTGPTTASLTVNFATSGTAASPADYAAIGASVVIPAGQPSATVTVTPVDDPTAEESETVVLTISPNAAYVVGASASATVTITDNDPPTVTVVANDATATESGPTTGQFTISRAGPTAAALTVNFAVTGSTAISATDYTALGASVLIPAGQSSATVTVTPVDDSLFEGGETVLLTISANAAYTVGAASNATVTILDNDTAPAVFALNGNTVNLTYSGLQAGTTYTVRRSFNLQVWTDAGQVTSANPTFSELKPAGQAKVFYKLKTP